VLDIRLRHAVVPIFAVDYAALSAQAAQACDERAPGTGQRIRQAHARWQTQHGAAQEKSSQAVQEQARAEATQRGLPLVPPAQLQARWRAQSLQDLKDKMAALDGAAISLYCERWPALFDRPDMQFAAMAASQPQSAEAQATFMADHQARFTEAARLCDARAPGTGTAVTQALLRWQPRRMHRRWLAPTRSADASCRSTPSSRGSAPAPSSANSGR
jgi:hypothetical protein